VQSRANRPVPDERFLNPSPTIVRIVTGPGGCAMGQVLLVEDTPFFERVIKRQLSTSAGLD
jgi:hypothetical protein